MPSIDTASNEILWKANMDNELKMYLEQNNLIKEKQLQPNWKHRSHSDWFSGTKSRWNKGNYNGCISNEHLTEDGLWELLLFKEAIDIIKVKIQSRHSKNVTHSMDSICERSSQTYYRLALHT
jgi:RNA-binding protein YhbY